jgi:hypothetical protein
MRVADGPTVGFPPPGRRNLPLAATPTPRHARLMNAARATLLTLIAAAVAAATIVPNASAAQRHASPAGTGIDPACSAAQPCSISQAVSGAKPGDEVIVDPGEYQLASWLQIPSNITVHGVEGQSRPRLLLSGAGVQVLGATLRYVQIEGGLGGWALTTASGATIDQVVVKALGYGADIQNSTIRNSIVVAANSLSPVIRAIAWGGANTSTLRNVTAINTGGGVAIEANAGSSPAGKATIHASNVIARGGPASVSLRSRTDSSGATATITVHDSNWSGWSPVGTNAVLDKGTGNQSAAPAFIDAAKRDYRQAAGSPTIDAGRDDASNGELDVDGDPRRIGATDIGADEFVVAPSASTGAASVVTDRSASLSGSVDAKGVPTTYRFEYGPTTAYGHSTPATGAGSGTSIVPAGAAVTGLSAGTTYHYRIVATNAGGVATGADGTLTTAVPAPPAPPATSPPSAQPFAGVDLVSRKLTYARRAIAVRLRCPAGTVGRCWGRTTLTARARRASARRVTLGRARFSIAPGNRARVKVRVTRAGRRLLNRVPRLRGRAVNVARDGASQSKTIRAAVTIRGRHR